MKQKNKPRETGIGHPGIKFARYKWDKEKGTWEINYFKTKGG
jgi:hypothetical protein